uniref:Uncharacterized protein n=1 Tax=Myotis myotis TaxID=51298 RepID=A0A7J7YDE3_MYOMY|nr:hypothetical protein mMyoMyo1_010963 [Myotis myotis]
MPQAGNRGSGRRQLEQEAAWRPAPGSLRFAAPTGDLGKQRCRCRERGRGSASEAGGECLEGGPPLRPDGDRAPPVVPVLVLGGREVAVTGTLLRKILGYPEKPREQLPGQPVRSPARIPLAGTRRLGEEGRGNMGRFRWIPDVLGARDGGVGGGGTARSPHRGP